jgi:hypothetical protein
MVRAAKTKFPQTTTQKKLGIHTNKQLKPPVSEAWRYSLQNEFHHLRTFDLIALWSTVFIFFGQNEAIQVDSVL